MAEVLRISPTHDVPFSSGGLRRSASHTSLFLDTSSTSQSENFARRYSSSLSSSAPSSPRLASHDLSSLPSYSSTPASSLSLRDQFEAEQQQEDKIQLPAYLEESDDDDGSDDDDITPSNSPPKSSPDVSKYPTSVSDHATKTPKSVGDDLALESQPSRHVDYLSHEWKEEEIWSSWRHIVGKRRILDNWERLENASWRTWAKSRGRLPTVSPEALNWMKDHDVTWLYGPLQSGKIHKVGIASPSSTPRLSRTDSFVVKKSILKKRSLSEAMLQRSLSSSTLVKQAVDSIVSQGPQTSRTQPIVGSPACKPGHSPFSTPLDTSTQTVNSSSSSSGAQTPSERRHIHFSEKVEQCIAINKDGEDDQEDDESESSICQDSDDESDDGVLMMKPEKGKERRLSSSCSGTPRQSFSGDTGQRTIAMLPSTRLRGDTPEPPESSNPKASFWGTREPLTKSSSQETLKPSHPSSNFLLGDDKEDVINHPAFPPRPPTPSSAVSRTARAPWAPAVVTNEDEEMKSRGLRRTPSGMFMPYDENEVDYNPGGLLGKVIDTVNTAKDIAHVIWNVGWRR